MGCSHRLWLAAALVLGVAAGAFAHERLRVSGSGIPLAWSSPASIGIVINSGGSDDIPDGSHETALRDAIQAWNGVPGSNLNLDEDTADLQGRLHDFLERSFKAQAEVEAREAEADGAKPWAPASPEEDRAVRTVAGVLHAWEPPRWLDRWARVARPDASRGGEPSP